MYFLVEPIRNTFSNVRPCSATLQRALQWASDVGAVPERSLSDPERSRSARATLVARPPTVTTSWGVVRPSSSLLEQQVSGHAF